MRPGALSALLEEIARDVAGVPARDATPGLRSGAVVDRFEILREVGRGGFGVVYEARDRDLGRTVAFKMVRAGSRRDVREQRLLQEAEAAARLSHPNIVTLFDVGRCEQGPYLVLEMLRGQTLGERLAQGTLSLEEALRIGVEVVKGLSHAHSKGVVHRDLKPGNVFLCEDGQVKVVDFGLAHAFGRRRQDGGTPAYMAPEQAAGAPEDERTDVFALGVMLFEMLSGRLPFGDARALASSTRAPALETPGASGLGELVGRMLEKEAVKRPRDAGGVLAALRAIRDGRGAAPLAVRGLPARKRAGGGARRASVPSIAVLPFTNGSGNAEEEYFSDGLSDEILNALAHVDGLRVTGRTSSFSFKGRNEDLRAIGRALHVRMVLEGSVRRSGDRVRIGARLVEVDDGLVVWGNTYDHELTEVFAVQCEISRSVAAAIGKMLLPRRALGRRPASVVAYSEFLLGRYLHNRGSQEDVRAAIQRVRAGHRARSDVRTGACGFVEGYGELRAHDR